MSPQEEIDFLKSSNYRLQLQYVAAQIEIQKANKGLRRLRAKLGRPQSRKGCYPVLKEVLEDAIEYAQSALIRHDSELGRTTDANRWDATRMELDIAKWKAILKDL